VLAAGEARRFRAPKQLAPFGGRPLLEWPLAALAAVPAIERVAVALGAHAPAIRASVELHGAEPLLVDDWREGQAASLRAGVRALASHADAIMVLLGDQPLVGPPTIARVAEAWDGAAVAVRATCAERPGHPVLLARALYAEIRELRGDTGAAPLLRGRSVVSVPCEREVALDVDTPAQLAALERSRAGQPSSPPSRGGAMR
jgi:molybdenum cofactor cytidylyltransferase